MNEHELNQALIKDLRQLRRNPPAIFVDQLDVEYDRVLVASHFVDAVVEALDLNDRKIATLETLTRELAAVLRNILQLEPAVSQNHPNVARAIYALGQLVDVPR